MQQKYIASELCVQKDVRMNTCKGNCYLKAHLQKENGDADISISYVKEKVELYFKELLIYQTLFIEYIKSFYLYRSISFPVPIGKDIFHPPALLQTYN